MKINWEVNIDEKKVFSKDIDFSFEFDIEFSFNSWHLVAKEINYKNEKEQQLINSNFKSFASEFKNLYLNETLENTKFSDYDNIKMYHLEDDIFLSKDGNICVLKADGFYDTEFMTSVYPINENTSKNLIKLSIYDDNEVIKFKNFEIDDSINEINQIPYKYEIEDEYELISINKSSIYIYDEFIKRDIKNEDKELIEALVSVLIFGNRNFLKWSDVYEKIKN